MQQSIHFALEQPAAGRDWKQPWLAVLQHIHFPVKSTMQMSNIRTSRKSYYEGIIIIAIIT
jgi:hypothetical protein